MASNMSVYRQRAKHSTVSFIDAHEDEITTSIHQRFQPFLAEGESPPDVRSTLRLVGRLVENCADRVIEADKANLDELDDDFEPRLDLAEAAEEVHDRLVDVRQILRGLYGPELSQELLAIDGPTANVDQPDLLWRQGEHTMERLRDPDVAPSRRKTLSVELDRSALADELEPAVKRLGAAHRVVHLERRELESTRAEKRRAMEEFDLDFRGCVRLIVGFCLLARRPDLAEKLDTAVLQPRRSSRSSEDDEDSAAEAEESEIDDSATS